MGLKIPKFEDGQILYERELYELAGLSIECFRWNSIAEKQVGFFFPLQVNYSLWNQFTCENGSLAITNLFVISSEGYPFIYQGRKKLEKIGKILYAILRLPGDSQSYDGDGYRIDFKWDLPEIESNVNPKIFIIELGQIIVENKIPKFCPEPPAFHIDSISNIFEEAKILKKNLEKYLERLEEAVEEKNIDCSEYIDRLEKLNLFSGVSRINLFIGDAKLSLKSAKGFYHRLVYEENGSKEQYEQYKNLRSRSLEIKLSKIFHGNKIEPKIFNPIDELIKMETKKGYQQQIFIEKLRSLFDSDSRLFKILESNTKKKESNTKQIFPNHDSRSFDRIRHLYQYELSEIGNNNCIIIEFNDDPANVDFVFTNENNLKNTKNLIPIKTQAEKKKSTNRCTNRYSLRFARESNLFIASPQDLIKKVELIKDSKGEERD